MPTIVVTTRTGNTHTITGQIGNSVMETARDAGIGDIAAICGALCSCATFHVKVASAFFQKLPEMSSDERELLGALDQADETSRLSCQIVINAELDGLRITVAPEE